MRIYVRSKDFFCEMSLFKKDFNSVEDLLIEAATVALEQYYERCNGKWFSVPYFIKTEINGKKYMVNSVLALSNASLYKFAESLKAEMIRDNLAPMVNQKIIKL